MIRLLTRCDKSLRIITNKTQKILVCWARYSAIGIGFCKREVATQVPPFRS